MKQQSVLQGLLVIAIAIAAAGLAVHAWVPSQITSSFYFASPGEPFVAEFKTPDVGGQDYAFNLDVSISISNSTFQNWTSSINASEYTDFAIINASEYVRFMNGTPVTSLVPVMPSSEFSIETFEGGFYLDARAGLTLEKGSIIYLVLVNKNASMANASMLGNAPKIGGTVFYSIFPSTYYIGYAMMIPGVAVFFVVLAIYFKGWKRWFTVGAGITTGIFLVRIGLLGFMLEFPEIFTTTINVELYWDFQFQTLIWTSSYASGIPLYSAAMPIAYTFPPLYADTCWLFNLLSLPAWKLALPLLAYNLLTGYLVFKIVLILTSSEKRATISMMLYYLNPFTIMYASFAWLTTSAYLFFLMLAFYLAMRGKSTWAMIVLGIGIAYKQYALAFFPVIVLAMLLAQRKQRWPDIAWNLVKWTLTCGLTIAIASLPYIITDPAGYLNFVFLAQAGGPGVINFLSTPHLDFSYPVNFNEFFFVTGFPSTITRFIAVLLAFNIPLVACALVIHVLFICNSLRYSRSIEGEEFTRRVFAEALFWAMLMAFYLHVLYSRGAFKYYFVVLAPFLAIFFDAGDLKLRKDLNGIVAKLGWKCLVPTIVSLIIVLLYRYDYLLVILAWAIYLGIARQFPIINGGFVETMMKKNEDKMGESR